MIEQSENDDKISKIIDNFTVCKGFVTRWLLDWRIMIVLFVLIVILFGVLSSQENWDPFGVYIAISGIITIFIVALLAHSTFGKMPLTFKRVWDRNIISLNGNKEATKNEYIKFLKNLENGLNSDWKMPLGFLVALLIFLGFCYKLSLYESSFFIVLCVFLYLSDGNILSKWNKKIRTIFAFIPVFIIFVILIKDPAAPLANLIGFFYMLFFVFCLYVGGVIIFKLGITARYIRKLTTFDLNIQPLHPDNCGGLKPIGNLCFYNAFTLIPATFWLAIWSLSWGHYCPQYFPNYSAIGLVILIGLVIFVIGVMFSFFYPLYVIHKSMVDKKIDHMKAVNEIANKIDTTLKSITKNVKNLDKDKGDKFLADIKYLKDVYNITEKFPVWPFDIKIKIKFASSIIIPTIIAISQLISILLGK